MSAVWVDTRSKVQKSEAMDAINNIDVAECETILAAEYANAEVVAQARPSDDRPLSADAGNPSQANAPPSPFAAGWEATADSKLGAPIWLPERAKYPPPPDLTGGNGRPSTRAECAAVAGTHNIGLRLNGDVIGVDRDTYAGKTGSDDIAAFESTVGVTFPPTCSSTSRGDDGGPGDSRIDFYRVPHGTRLRGSLGPSVEIIQRHHRYAVVAPSVHPSGALYRWYDNAGEPMDRPPFWDDLAELPAPMITALRSVGDGTTAPAASPEEVHRFLSEYTGNDRPQALDGIRTRLARPRTKCRHDTAVDVACWIVREAAAGYYPGAEGVAVLRQWWAKVMDDPKRREGTEIDDAIAFGISRLDLEESKARVAELKANAQAPAHEDVWDVRPDNVTADGEIIGADGGPSVSGLVDWAKMWANPHEEEDWLAEPFLVRGRAHALVAAAKTGKSLLALEVAAALATGRPPTSVQPATDPMTVLYLDQEMTEADLRERLADMGYGPGDDLCRLRYHLLADLPPLDTEAGGAALFRLADHYDAQLVIIDTMSRVVDGDEDKADTLRAFARHTGTPLKRAGRTVLRLDHTGKDTDKGARGTSAKRDDVDVQWVLDRSADGLKLKSLSRVRWVPEHIALIRDEDPLRHVVQQGGYGSGTKALVDRLNELGVSPTASVAIARKALKAAGEKAGTTLIGDAVRARKAAAAEGLEMPSAGPKPYLDVEVRPE